MPSKKCGKCGETKEVSEFHKDRNRKDGLHPRCKACRVDHSRQYYLENAEAKKDYQRKRYHENVEAERERNRQYYLENAEALKDYQRQYRKDNPDKKAAWSHRRRARKAGVPSDGIPVDITGKPCYVCGADAEAVDHVIPIAKGGHDTVDNKAPICHSCNSAKRDLTWPGQPDWDDFLKRRNQ